MCLIIVSPKGKLPTDDILEKAQKANSDGIGYAYITANKKAVAFKKGLKLNELAADLHYLKGKPFVIHFRMASSGGINKYLTHPFVISATSPLYLKGITTDSLLFHNGHYSDYKSALLNVCITNKQKLPTGLISDTRGIAVNAHYLGNGYLQLIDEKLVVISPKGIRIFKIDGFEHDKESGLYFSNTYFYSQGYDYTAAYSAANTQAELVGIDKAEAQAESTGKKATALKAADVKQERIIPLCSECKYRFSKICRTGGFCFYSQGSEY